MIKHSSQIDSTNSINAYVFEIFCQPIPATLQNNAIKQLEKFVAEFFPNHAHCFKCYCTNRRMVILGNDLPDFLTKHISAIKGPKTNAPSQVVDKFLEKYSKQYDVNLAQEQNTQSNQMLMEENGYWYIKAFDTQISLSHTLLSMQQAILTNFSWPKTMIWQSPKSYTQASDEVRSNEMGSDGMESNEKASNQKDSKDIEDKSMNFSPIKWIRPIENILSMLNDQVLDFSLNPYHLTTSQLKALHSNNITHIGTEQTISSIQYTINHASDYLNVLKEANIELDNNKRKAEIMDALHKLHTSQKLFFEDTPQFHKLVEEMSCSTETMHIYLCNTSSLAKIIHTLPNRFIQICVQEHQQAVCLFSCEANQISDRNNEYKEKIISEFMLVAQKPATKQMIDDALGVMQCRLEDLQFMYEQDTTQYNLSLDMWQKQLQDMEIYTGLGSMYDRTVRLQNIVSKIYPDQPTFEHNKFDTDKLDKQNNPDTQQLFNITLLQQAIKLYKIDLCSQVVKEFPALHGFHIIELMHQTDPKSYTTKELSKIITEYIKPRNIDSAKEAKDTQTHAEQSSIDGLLLGLLDRLDALVGFFRLNLTINSSQDPLGLRRIASEIIQYGLLLFTEIKERTQDKSFASNLSNINTLIKIIYFQQTQQEIDTTLAKKIQHFLQERMQYHIRNHTYSSEQDISNAYSSDASGYDSSTSDSDLTDSISKENPSINISFSAEYHEEERAILQTNAKNHISNFWMQPHKAQALYNIFYNTESEDYNLLLNTYKRLSNFIKNKNNPLNETIDISTKDPATHAIQECLQSSNMHNLAGNNPDIHVNKSNDTSVKHLSNTHSPKEYANQYLLFLITLSKLLQDFFDNNLVLDPEHLNNRINLLHKCKHIFDSYTILDI